MNAILMVVLVAVVFLAIRDGRSWRDDDAAWQKAIKKQKTCSSCGRESWSENDYIELLFVTGRERPCPHCGGAK